MANVAWIRELQIIFTNKSTGKTVTYGADTKNDNLAIEVKGYKYMGTMKDSCTIRIHNLTYSEMIRIIKNEYYGVEVKCGYKSSGMQTIFKGGVLYISNELNQDRTSTAVILCASELVAKYGQRKINLTLNSGINMYAAIRQVCTIAGIAPEQQNIDNTFKTLKLTAPITVNETAAQFITRLADENSQFVTNSDSIKGSVVSVRSAYSGTGRVIRLNSDNIILTNGYPRLNSNGLSLSIMPTFNFMCGDRIIIDNSIINLAATTQEESYKNYSAYLDEDGEYIIYQMEYSLENRGSAFSLDLLCKSKSLFQTAVGGLSR